jgi:hypothetical protein
MKRLLLLVLLSITGIGRAQWNPDPAQNNLLCADAPLIGQNIGNDHLIRVIHDGNGGAFVCWFDFPNITPLGGMDIKLQHISSAGMTWPGNGITVTNADYNQRFPEMILDGTGAVVVTWYSDVDGKVYAQRVDANGNTLWAANGLPVCNAASGQFYPNIIRNENGNVTIVWKDSRASAGFSVYAQQLDMNGNLIWNPAGVLICSDYVYTSGVRPIQIISDGSNGVIACWSDTRAGFKPYVQRLLANGTVAWTADGIPACTLNTNEASLVSDGNAGAILTWSDNRNNFATSYDVFAQHIDQNGNILWDANGTTVCNAAERQSGTLIVPDGTGGAVISWNDFRDIDGNLIYAQRINAVGVTQWASNGIEITNQAPGGGSMKMTADGTGGAIITWNNAAPAGLRAQRINAAGSFLLPTGGSVVCSLPTTAVPEVTATGSGNCILAWVDYRNPGFTGIYGSRLLANGTLPVTGLSFYGVKDQTFNKLYWTTASEQNNRGFDIERSKDGVNYQNIGFLAAQPQSNSLHHYSFADLQPLNGKNYYRLKQWDIDNRSKFSNIILLNRPAPGTLTVFPNPANSFITIQTKFTAPIQVADATGKILRIIQNSGNSVTVDISSLPPGLYYCRSGEAIVAFIKQDR